MSAPFTVTNAAEGLHAVAETRRARRRQRDLGLCCRDGSCGACCSEAEAIKEERSA